ncbi:hypothetical protein HGA88_06000 [Candidatus Roizmanbacteria bacterium]|nr:hypothetical protein [Candidatus Roizmanbacteria bacterium]
MSLERLLPEQPAHDVHHSADYIDHLKNIPINDPSIDLIMFGVLVGAGINGREYGLVYPSDMIFIIPLVLKAANGENPNSSLEVFEKEVMDNHQKTNPVLPTQG